MNAITGGYDVVIQVQERIVNNIFSAMHVAGAVQHRAVFVHQGQRGDLQIGRPSVALMPTSPTEQTTRARLTVRANVQLRPLADASALGTVRIAHITARATVACFPGTNSQPASIKYDWAETTAADIVLAGSPDDPALRTVITQVISGLHGANPASQASNATFRFLPGNAGNLVSIGLDLGATGQGAWNQLNLAFLGSKDWSLALGRDYFLAKIREGMCARWQSLPPPYGMSPVLLSDQVACTLELAGNCFDHARRRVYLDRFEVSLSPGAIVFSGRARAVTDAWYAPDVSAGFSFGCVVGLDANQHLTIAMGASTIDFNQWYAEIFDWLTFGALQDVVKNAFRDALLSDQARHELSGLFSSNVIENLAAMGRSVNVSTSPRADRVAVLADAVIFSGSVEVAETSRSPIADLIVLRHNGDPDLRTFQAGGSWAPGGDLVGIDWNFGDGATLSQRGDNVRLAVEHRYLPGEYVADLRVLDCSGRTSSYSTLVRVGLMKLACASPVIERTQSPVSATFTLTEEDSPIDGVNVTLSAGSWQKTGISGQDGSSSFSIHPAHFATLAQPYAVGDWWATHYITVTAAKAGYRSETLTLLLADRMLQLRGDTLVGQAGTASLNIGVFQQDAPVAGAEVVVTGKGNWQTRQVTPASGWVHCTVGSARFFDLPKTTPIGNGCNATAYVLVDASKAGYHPAAQKTIYLGYKLPDNPIYQEARQKLEKWWLWAEELSAAIDRGNPFDPSVASALPDVTVAIATFKAVLALEADSSSIQLLSLTDVLGISSGAEENIIGRIGTLCTTLERNLSPLHKAAGAFKHQTTTIHPQTQPRALGMKERLPKPVVGKRRKERASRLLASAEVAARLRADNITLPGKCREALSLLGQISALERLPSRFLPATLLLGMNKSTPEVSVTKRLDTLLDIAQRNIDASAAHEPLETHR